MGRRSTADAKWLQQVRRSGTTADKVAAMSVLVQDGAVANLHSLDGLLAMCSKRGGEQGPGSRGRAAWGLGLGGLACAGVLGSLVLVGASAGGGVMEGGQAGVFGCRPLSRGGHSPLTVCPLA